MSKGTAGREKQTRGAAASGIAKRGWARDVIRSVTGRKRSEEALRESEASTRSIIETALDAFISIDARAVITAWNAQAERTFGWSRQEALGRPLPDTIIPPHLRASFKRGVEHFLATGEGPILNKRIELMALHRDGHGFPVDLTTWAVPSGDTWTFNAFLRDITERKRTEEALSRREQEMRVLADNVPALFSYVDADGRYRFLNKRYEEWFGIPATEIIGKPYREVLGESTYDLIRDRVEEVLSGQHVRFEELLPYKHGGRRWVIADYVPDTDEHGKVKGFFALVTDITERKRAEELVRQAEQRYRDLFERAPVMYVITRNEDGNPIVADCNELFLSTLGYTRAEVLERPLADFYTHASRAELLERGGYQRALKGGFTAEERQLLTRDGRVVQTLLRALPETDPDGHVFGTRAMFVDITERKRAEEALRQSEELLEKTFASLDEAVFVVEPNSRTIVACNLATERIFAYSEEEMLGRNTEFLHVDRAMYEEFGRKLFPALDANGVFHTEYQMRRKDGSVFFSEHTVTEMVDDPGCRTGVVSVVRDITERKRMEGELQKAREELEARVEHQMLRRNPYSLTFRELRLLHLVAAGESDKQIGTTLGISPLTAQKHISNILAKMGASSRTEAGVRAVREGLLD